MDWALSVAGEALAAILAAAVLGALGWIGSSIRGLRRDINDARDAADARLDAVEKNLVKVEDLDRHNVIGRLQAAELKLAGLEERCLGEGAVQRVHERVDLLAKEVHAMSGQLESVAGSTALIHDYLLNKGGK